MPLFRITGTLDKGKYMARKVNKEGLDKIKQWEGLRLTAYQDGAGVWTIGYGHTSAAGAPIVKKGMKITEAEATQILANDLRNVEADVERLVKVPLTDNQFAALVSFQLNTGSLGVSTLLKKLNKKDYDAVPVELMKWVNITVNKKKVRSQGLVNRRSAEVGLWAKGSFVSSQNVVAEVAPEPLVNKETVSWGAGIFATLGLAGAGTGPIQYALAGVILVGFGVGLYLLLKKRKSS